MTKQKPPLGGQAGAANAARPNPQSTAAGAKQPPAKPLFIRLLPGEVDQVMNEIIRVNAGVQVFLLLDERIQEAKKRDLNPETDLSDKPNETEK
jgi:hypothetical protein